MRGCFLSAHSVGSSVLSVEWLGDIKDPRVPIDDEKPLGSLIGTWSADLVSYSHFVLIAGLNLKDNAESSLKTGPQKQTHFGKSILLLSNPHLPSTQISDMGL